MDTFLRKSISEKWPVHGQRSMQVSDKSQLPVKWGKGTSLFYTYSVKPQGQPAAAMGNK